MRAGNKDPHIIDELSGAMADLDSDGVDEIFLRLSSSFELCGSAGCEVFILKKDGERWRRFGGFYDNGDNFTLLDKTDNGVREIVTHLGGIPEPAVEKWDGEQFVSAD